MSSIGENIVIGLKELNPQIGSNSNETMNDHIITDFDKQTIAIWDVVASNIIGSNSSEIFKEFRVYDGTEKKSNPLENHVDNFISEEEFNETDPPDYKSLFGRNKQDITPVPVYITNTEPGTLDDLRSGYRIVIKDKDVTKRSIIRYSIEALDRNLENDLPDDYKHVSPGEHYIINKEDGEWQLFFSNKGAYYIRYGIWNGPRNEESIPAPVVYQDTGL